MSELERVAADYASCGEARFHMPGHKGRSPGGVLPEEIYPLDITELPFSDELFEADAAIADAERTAARVFGSGASLISPFGATSCIQTMVRLAREGGGKLLLPRNMHYSVFNAVGTADMPAVIAEVGRNGDTPAGVLSPMSVRQAFDDDPDICALFITSVDYYGYINDTAAFAELCGEYGKLLLVDNSHGAHLRFLDGYCHPLSAGADMVCDSIHKTLPALTGSALLHLRDGGSAAKASKLMKRICSSSPSYPIMLSAVAAVGWAERIGNEAYGRLAQRLDAMRERLAGHGYTLCGGSEPCRIYLSAEGLGATGAELNRILGEAGCLPEFADEHGVLLMFSPMNTEKELDTAEKALLSLPCGKPRLQKPTERDIIPRRVMSIAEAMKLPCEAVPFEESAGRVAAECIGRYPPGLPAVISGEEIPRGLTGIGMKRVLTVKVSADG